MRNLSHPSHTGGIHWQKPPLLQTEGSVDVSVEEDAFTENDDPFKELAMDVMLYGVQAETQPGGIVTSPISITKRVFVDEVCPHSRHDKRCIGMHTIGILHGDPWTRSGRCPADV